MSKNNMATKSANLNKEKYKNALLYFISECGNDHLGIMKLNKLFYYLDFISYRDRKKSVTNETYVHLPKGPLASVLLPNIVELAKKESLIEHKEDASEKYGKRNRFRALKKANLSVFDEYEKDLLQRICVEFKNWTTDELVAQTHTEAPWVFSRPSESLNYDNADDIELFSQKVSV